MKEQIAAIFLTLLVAASALAAKPGGTTPRELTYAGLPAITYVSDSNGLLSEVRMGGKQIVSYDWSREPYAVPVRFFNQWSINTSVMPDGSGTQQVIDPSGTQRGAAVVLAHARELGRPTMLLDALAADLGLPPEWQDGQQVTSANDVQLRANGKTINIKFHSVGPGMRVGESEGKAVLWDLDLPLGVKGLLGQILPSRLIVTSSGIVHLAADSRIIGAIDGIWTNDPRGNGIIVRKQFDAAPTRGAGMGQSHITSTAASVGADPISGTITDLVPVTSPDVHAEMMWLCAMSEYYVWHTDGINWWSETQYSRTYCDSGGGGVGGCSVNGLEPRAMSGRPVSALTICNGDGSGGGPGGGTGTGSNNQITDILLHAAVDAGKLNASVKLQSAQCQAMIKMLQNAAGISLWDVMTSYAPAASSYLSGQVTFRDGANVVYTDFFGYFTTPCSDLNTKAWTWAPGVHEVQVCTQFKQLDTSAAGSAVIHEMLHTLGLPEYPYGYTTDQITDMVNQWCP